MQIIFEFTLFYHATSRVVSQSIAARHRPAVGILKRGLASASCLQVYLLKKTTYAVMGPQEIIKSCVVFTTLLLPHGGPLSEC